MSRIDPHALETKAEIIHYDEVDVRTAESDENDENDENELPRSYFTDRLFVGTVLAVGLGMFSVCNTRPLYLIAF